MVLIGPYLLQTIIGTNYRGQKYPFLAGGGEGLIQG